LTKHVKIAALSDGPRVELAEAISEVVGAAASAAKAEAAVAKAEAHLRAAKLAHSKAEDALGEATSPPRTLEQKLREVSSVDEKLEVVDEHNASLRRDPLTAEDLSKARATVRFAGDALTIAQRDLEVAESDARPAASVLRRARDRRTRAIHALVGPHIATLMLDVQRKTEELIAARASLNFARSLVDPRSDEQRKATVALNRLSFPCEAGLNTDDDLAKRDAAVVTWSSFSEMIAQDANTPLP
jgi:hypothetical protein